MRNRFNIHFNISYWKQLLCQTTTLYIYNVINTWAIFITYITLLANVIKIRSDEIDANYWNITSTSNLVSTTFVFNFWNETIFVMTSFELAKTLLIAVNCRMINVQNWDRLSNCTWYEVCWSTTALLAGLTQFIQCHNYIKHSIILIKQSLGSHVHACVST